ncbi:hypothetical protein HJFPF1_04098 [Paramyrothecium foliicola]|nr:hypothetical protein HJFPF1_04098 [Paramyrothecium foliicola]
MVSSGPHSLYRANSSGQLVDPTASRVEVMAQGASAPTSVADRERPLAAAYASQPAVVPPLSGGSQSQESPTLAVSPQSAPTTARKRQRVESSRAEATYPRKRAITACRLCRSRKVKCNNARPVCGNCEASGAPCVLCIKVPSARADGEFSSSFDPASILILEKLDKVLSRLDQASTTTTAPVQFLLNATDVNTTAPGRKETETIQTIEGSGPALEKTREQEDDSYFDQLQIPTCRTTADAVLQWPIFCGRFPPNHITDAAFLQTAIDADREHDTALRRPEKRGLVLDEDTVNDLVRRFLELVHIKNPILDIESLWASVEDILDSGLRWDQASCLVLLACALGSVATPFPREQFCGPDGSFSSIRSQQDDLRAGEGYYHLAQKRFGLLQLGIVASQCYFLAGVYKMYTMHPIIAWSHFQSATKAYHLHLECKARQPQQEETPFMSSKGRHLEQRLYWSCYKTECELRAELNLPNSSLVDVQNPELHPSPPTFNVDEMAVSPETGGSGSRNLISASPISQQQKEQTWFYYLTEITLRRMANRVLNMLYTESHVAWTEECVRANIHAAEQFEQQLDEWYATLPAPIRFESDSVGGEELPYHTRGRALQIKMWLYTPFLYYAIHAPSEVPRQGPIWEFAEKAIAISYTTIVGEPTGHRHHGTWYHIMSIATCCLFIIAAVRRGNVPVPKEWRKEVEGAIQRIRYWEDEGPGVTRAIHVLTTYLMDI